MLGALLVVGAGCGSGGDANGDADGSDGRRVLTEADSTSEVSVDTGDELEVRLPSNPSTGYSWRVEPAPTVVELGSSSFEDAGTDRAGAEGTEVFVFDVVAGGAEILRLEYVRLFDDPIVPEQVVEYVVRVDGAPWPPTDATPAPTATANTATAPPAITTD